MCSEKQLTKNNCFFVKSSLKVHNNFEAKRHRWKLRWNRSDVLLIL